jgi:CheY-like chemotaxis protein
MKILLADDDVFTLTLLQGYLEDNGYEVVTVTNGGEALYKLENETGFDLILSDIFMPVVSGIMMGNLVKQFFFSNTPVILFSATDNAAVRRAANLAGADGFLAKPITKDKLIKTILEVQNKGRRQGSR